MRLRLSVHRHGIPPVKTLWNTSTDTANRPNTVSQLLDQINEVFPLESENWGLEDYVVEVDGFECLHYAALDGILKENDHITIRPLQTPEIRARTVSGRHQISAAGQHLVDGIPFGKGSIRRPARPPIHIPPRKRRRLTAGDEEDIPAVQTYPQPVLQPVPQPVPPPVVTYPVYPPQHGYYYPPQHGYYHPQQHGVDRGPYRPAGEQQDPGMALMPYPSDDEGSENEYEPSLDATSGASSTSGYSEQGESGTEDTWTIPRKRARFSPESVSRSSSASVSVPYTVSESESESDLESDFEAESDADADADLDSYSDSDSESDSDSASDSESDSDTSSSDGTSSQITATKRGAPGKDCVQQGKSAIPKPALPSQEVQRIFHGPPGLGKKCTRDRNARRRDHKKLLWLKSRGVLPSDANRRDLAEWRGKAALESRLEDSDSGSSSTSVSLSESTDSPTDSSDSEPEVQAIQRQPMPSTSVHQTPSMAELEQFPPAIDPELEARRQKLLQSIADGGIDITERPAKRARLEDPTTNNSPNLRGTLNSGRRSLDTAAARRMVLGSLALRDPNKPSPRAKGAQTGFRGQRPAAAEPDPAEAEVPKNTAKGQWESKLNISAVECLVNDVELTAPPYPFKQAWDPQFRALRDTGRNRNKKKRGRKSATYQESTWDENGYEESGVWEEQLDYDEGPTVLNYDEPSTVQPNDADHITEDGFPPLPAQISSLSALNEADLTPGAIIVFKQIICGKETNWSPTMSEYRTARVEEKQDDGTFLLTLAPRDRPQRNKIYDQNGRRVFEKFEMHGLDDNELAELEDDSVVELGFAEFKDAKLLKHGKVDTEEQIAAGENADAHGAKDGQELASSSEVRHASIFDTISNAYQTGYREGLAVKGLEG